MNMEFNNSGGVHSFPAENAKAGIGVQGADGGRVRGVPLPRKASLGRFEFLCQVRAAGTAMRVVAARAVFPGKGPTVWTQ